MTIGPHKHQQRAVKNAYPAVEGLTAETTKQTGDKFLVTKAVKSLVRATDKVGF